MSGLSLAELADRAMVDAIAQGVDPPYSLLVRLQSYTALRWCEAVALQRKHCHLPEGSIEVERQVVETAAGPKLRPLSRIYGWVRLDADLGLALAEHLDHHVPPGRNALVFSDSSGAPLQRSWFEEEQWWPALRRVGLGDVSWGVDSLQTARLWSWVQETQRERRERAAPAQGQASDWRRP